MTRTTPEEPVSHEDDPRSDAEKVADQPFIDTHDQLNDSADSYVSPARNDGATP
ncbi:MAG: hypothetical protein ABW091_09280 [Microbacterium sp.]